MTFQLQNALTSPQLQLVVCPSQTAFTGTTINQVNNLMTSPYASVYAYGANTSQFHPQGFTKSMSTARIFGMTPNSIVGDADLDAVINTLPVEQWYWNFAAYESAQNLASAAVLTVIVDYDIEFFERVPTTLDFEMKVMRARDVRRLQREIPDTSPLPLGASLVRDVNNYQPDRKRVTHALESGVDLRLCANDLTLDQVEDSKAWVSGPSNTVFEHKSGGDTPSSTDHWQFAAAVPSNSDGTPSCEGLKTA